MSKIEVDAIDKQSGSTLTLGGSGTAVTLAAGATQSGFGRSGSVNWDTTAKTAGFTGVSGNGYFINTTAGTITVNLPASPSAGDIMAIKDYTGTFATNTCTVGRNGSNIRGAASDFSFEKNNSGGVFIYVDGTEGWQVFLDGSDLDAQKTFIEATGGNAVVTCGDFKTHIFTGPGTFAVTSAGCAGTTDIVDYLVVAGGGGGGPGYAGGGGGAGGFRMANSYSLPAPTTSPLANPSGIPVSVQSYPITVGAGGPGGSSAAPCAAVTRGGSGGVSTFSTITSAGGGGGGTGGQGGGPNPNAPPGGGGGPGGSGGGGGSKDTDSSNAPGPGTGNTPPVSPPQGNNGGAAGADGFSAYTYASGGGGAGAVGTKGDRPGCGQNGAGGIGSFIADGFVGPTAPSYGTAGPVSSTRYFAGGGGGATDDAPANSYPRLGGAGGGGKGSTAPTSGATGTINTGGGGGGIYGGPSPAPVAPFNTGYTGGSGIVMIRYKFQ